MVQYLIKSYLLYVLYAAFLKIRNRLLILVHSKFLLSHNKENKKAAPRGVGRLIRANAFDRSGIDFHKQILPYQIYYYEKHINTTQY